MRLSKDGVSTLRDDPQEAELASHKLMLRAGMIKKLSSGLYTFMPLGLRVLRNVEQIIREEMNRAGAVEILMPALQPREIWDRSNRYEVMGDGMFKISDRQHREMVLGPTHEEVITEIISNEIKSYRQLPRTLYQIQTKYRDEIRPRFGLMRAKEFIMKDAYSFDVGWDEADTSYDAMYNAYGKIFRRCGLRTKIVEADTGPMGGNRSHEFMALADAGEDGLLECPSCSYAANVERAERGAAEPKLFPDNEKEAEPVSTPGMRTVEEVSTFFKSSPDRLIKTLIYLADDKPIAALIPGDRTMNDMKLARAVGAETLILANEQTVLEATGAPVGFAGPSGLELPIYADMTLKGYKGALTGGNQADTHFINIDLERDATIEAFADLAFGETGDPCPRCNDGKLVAMRGIEVGHVFKLGTKYAKSFDATFLDAEGKEQLVVMGCYGIGVSRTLQAAVEQNYDKHGILWPMSLAPYKITMLGLQPDDEETMRICDNIVDAFRSSGEEVLFDERDERPGVKFKDADLVGCPIRIVVSKRSLEKGAAELKLRSSEDSEFVPIADIHERVMSIINKEMQN